MAGLLNLAIGFFVLAIIAGILGARGVAGMSMDIAKWLVIIFIILAVISLICVFFSFFAKISIAYATAKLHLLCGES
jgi:uncharacterized membrane protein YtjA (UPF0391 family)